MEKKFTFTKVIVSTLLIIFTSLQVYESIFAIWYCIKYQDASIMTYTIPATSAILTAIVGFYTWKAKAENVVKIGKKDKDIASDISNIVS